ncbi:hypothetical protein ACKVMT_14115 [Halobacteriales archaeon Cl-PHB]
MPHASKVIQQLREIEQDEQLSEKQREDARERRKELEAEQEGSA